MRRLAGLLILASASVSACARPKPGSFRLCAEQAYRLEIGSAPQTIHRHARNVRSHAGKVADDEQFGDRAREILSRIK